MKAFRLVAAILAVAQGAAAQTAPSATEVAAYDGLHRAAHLGHQEGVRRLIAGGAPLDHVNNLGWTALIEAMILRDGGPDRIETVRALVEAGADRTIADRDGVTPLQHAEARGHEVIAAILRAS